MGLGDFVAHMEREGLGRPSTYATHAQTLLDRELIVSLSDITLTTKGRTILQSLRQSDASCFDAGFTKQFLRQLDDIESGKRVAADCLSEWLNPMNASIATEWLDGCDIQGDVAALFYETRDELGHSTVFWPVGEIPKELDPELVLPADSPLRVHRAQLNHQAAENAGEEWQRYSNHERIARRIELAAQFEKISVELWRSKHQFDLLSRWITGWYPVRNPALRFITMERP